MKLRLGMSLYLVSFAFSVSLFSQESSDRTAAGVATKAIRPEQIRAHIRFLADSLLAGRFPGSPGYDIAARYVAAGLEGMGLHPAVNGGWFQPVPLQKALTDAAADRPGNRGSQAGRQGPDLSADRRAPDAIDAHRAKPCR